MTNNFIIRFGQQKDLATIVKIYNQAISSKIATGDTVIFTVDERITWFQKYKPNTYPIYVVEKDHVVLGYCTLSPYRPGRKAMSSVAEISYFIDYDHHGKGLASALIQHAISDCHRINKKHLLAVLLDINKKSIRLLEKFNFSKWGHFPDIIELEERTCSHIIYGLQIDE